MNSKGQRVMTKEEADVPFKGPYKKAGEERKDEYGNKVKNVAKYLAKKAMNTQKEEVDQIDELSTKTLEKYKNAARADAYDADTVDDDPRFRKRAKGIKTATKKIRSNFVKGVDEAFEQISEAPRVGMDYTHASEKSKFDSGHRAKLLNPEGRTSYLSQKSYKTAKHAKEAAKFYHSVAHLPMQTVDNKMSQYNKAYDAKHKMSEEVEQIDELSKATLGSYVKKATNQAFSRGYSGGAMTVRGDMNRDSEEEKAGEKNVHKAIKRVSGVTKAVNKLTQEEQDFVDSLNDADIEQIDELSDTTLKSYAKKAMDQATSAHGYQKDAEKSGDHDRARREMKHKWKRQAGARNAIDRLGGNNTLAKEEAEQIDEISKGAALKYLAANKKDDTKARETGDYDRMTKRMRGTDMAVRKYTAKPGSKYVRVPATEEVELDEARGRPRKAGAKDFTINPKTKEKLMHNNPEHMKKIEALQRNGVIPVPKIEANQHIMQQLQRAKLSMRGGETINFTHGDSQHVAGHHAAKLLTKYAGMKPDEKEAFQKKIGHSHANLKSEL